MRWAARRDANEAAIVTALEAIGVDVWRLSAEGLPDLLTHRRGVWLPIEVKTRTGRLTPAQRITRQRVRFPIARTVAEALALFGIAV